MIRAGAVFLGATLLAGVAAPAATTPDSGPMLRFTATTANVSGAPDSIRIDLFRWLTDAERDKLMAAWALKPAANGGAGRGGGRGGRGGAAPASGRGRGAARGGAPDVTERVD